MLIKLNELIINTNNIVTISPYENVSKKQFKNKETDEIVEKDVTDTGIIINGERYIIYTAVDLDKESTEILRNHVRSMIATIVAEGKSDVQITELKYADNPLKKQEQQNA